MSSRIELLKQKFESQGDKDSFTTKNEADGAGPPGGSKSINNNNVIASKAGQKQAPVKTKHGGGFGGNSTGLRPGSKKSFSVPKTPPHSSKKSSHGSHITHISTLTSVTSSPVTHTGFHGNINIKDDADKRRALKPSSVKKGNGKGGGGGGIKSGGGGEKFVPYERKVGLSNPGKLDETISKDSDDSQHALLSREESPSRQDMPRAMEKFRKLSEGKGPGPRARQETGAPLTTTTTTTTKGTADGSWKERGRAGDEGGGGGRLEEEKGAAESNGLPLERMDDTEDDDDDGEREEEEYDEDSSEVPLSACSGPDDVFWDEKHEFGFLDDGFRVEEDSNDDEYHSEGCLLESSNLFTKKQPHSSTPSQRSRESGGGQETIRNPAAPRVIPLRQNRLLQGKCYKEYRLSRSLPNLVADDRLVLSITNAQGLFQKAQQRVRSRRVSRYRHSRRNKPPVPRKPSHLSPKLNNNRPSGKSSGPATANKSPKKAQLTSAVSTGSSVSSTSNRRVNKLSEDQRTYDQVCYEPPDDFDPPPMPKSKNLERFFGMKPDMAKPITSIKPCSEDFLRGNTTSPLRLAGRGQSNHEEGEHYAVVDLPDRTSLKKKDKKQKNSSSGMMANKTDPKRISSGGHSGDSGIHIVLPDDVSQRDSSRASSDYQDHGGSMDSSIASSESTDSDYEDDIDDLPDRPTENITFTNKSHEVAYEVLTSERQYVDRLHLLHKVFEQKIRTENTKHNWIPKDVITVIFSNLQSIYGFHTNFLLKQLEDRMKEWTSNPCLGDILVRLSPFLKLYTDYVGNFDNAIKALNTWTSKAPKFASLLQDIQKKPMCMCLTLQHHMLEPVQRIPRYEMLLKAYLKKLPAESNDRENAEKALGLISKAAQHSNEMMHTIEHFDKLLKLNEKIDGESIIDPSRRLLKEGKIIRVAARSGERLDRYLFLFNDMLLCCTQKRQLTGSIIYKVKDKVDIDEVRLLDGASTRFRLERSPKSLEFETSTDEQKEEWMAVLLEAIKEMVRKKDSFKTSLATSEREDDYALPLGECPPSYIRDEDTTMCMKCGNEFNFTRRRHHCKACGAVVCGKCSGHNTPLVYDDNKMNRVCDKCYHLLREEDDPNDSMRKSFVDINENKSYTSFLWYMQPKGKTWERYWVAATEQDLFALRAPKDVRAFLTLPIKLYQAFEVEDGDGIDRDYAFKLSSEDNSFYFAAENKEIKYNWLLVLNQGLSTVLRGSQRDSTNL